MIENFKKLKVTVTNKKTERSDSETASPYYSVAKEQEKTLFKEIMDRSNWEKNECEYFSETIPYKQKKLGDNKLQEEKQHSNGQATHYTVPIRF